MHVAWKTAFYASVASSNYPAAVPVGPTATHTGTWPNFPFAARCGLVDRTVFPYTLYYASSGANIVACASDGRHSLVLLALSAAVGTPQSLGDSKGRGTRLHVTSWHLGQLR